MRFLWGDRACDQGTAGCYVFTPGCCLRLHTYADGGWFSSAVCRIPVRPPLLRVAVCSCTAIGGRRGGGGPIDGRHEDKGLERGVSEGSGPTEWSQKRAGLRQRSGQRTFAGFKLVAGLNQRLSLPRSRGASNGASLIEEEEDSITGWRGKRCLEWLITRRTCFWSARFPLFFSGA